MRNPTRWRNVGLVACAVGLIAAIAPFQLPPNVGGDGLRATFFCLGLTGLVFGGATAWWGHRDGRAKASLERGDDVIARWPVDPATWHAFLEADTHARDGLDWLPNELSVAGEVPAEGIEVIVGREAIEIGGSVHVLPRHGAPEVLDATLGEGHGRPDTIELHLRYPGGGTGASGVIQGPTHTRLAFPVAAGRWRDARRVVGYYAGGRPGAPDFFHGRGDGSDPEDLSSCWSCGYQTYQFRSTCPQCGAGLLSRRWSRRFGTILIVLGLALTVGMIVLLAKLSPLLLHPGTSVGGTRFTGTRAQALMIWGVLSAVLAFGATTTAYGVWQAATGRRNRNVAFAMLALFGGLCALARWL
jgi:hypothetical protein